jgi:hydroperoxide dehydratase
MFKVMIKAMTNVDIDNIPESDRPSSADLTKWTGLQLVPVLSVGLPAPIDDLVLHAAPLPFALAKGGYDKMFKFLQKYAGEALDVARKFDLNRDDATHNLIFFIFLNGHGGFLRFFPIILKYVNTSGN